MTTPPPPPPPPPAPGWYPNPAGGGDRYWDGTAWTEHTFSLAATPQLEPPKKSAAGKVFRVIGFAFLALFALGWGLRFFVAGYTHNPKELLNPSGADRDRAMITWTKEKVVPVLRNSPQLWVDFERANGLDAFHEVCGKMRQLWVVDLGTILPAPIPDINSKFEGARDAAKTATDHCLALNSASSPEQVAAADQDFETLRARWTDVVEATGKWANSP